MCWLPWTSLTTCLWRTWGSSVGPSCMRTVTPWQSSSITGGMGTLACVSSVWRTSQVRDAIDFWSLTFCLCPFLYVGFLRSLSSDRKVICLSTLEVICVHQLLLVWKSAFKKAYFNLCSNVYRSIFMTLRIFMCVCFCFSKHAYLFTHHLLGTIFSFYRFKNCKKILSNLVRRSEPQVLIIYRLQLVI